jgi:serine/threonine protein kinase
LKLKLETVICEGPHVAVLTSADTVANNGKSYCQRYNFYLLDQSASGDQQQANRRTFEREADLLAELDNEHIPKIFDRFSDGNRHYLVMEFVRGQTLEQMTLSAGGRLDERSAIPIGIQTLTALVYLHSQMPPIVFRDLKPENIMITPEGRVRLIDFGIARHFTSSKVTVIGTPGYAPPEQYKGVVDPRTDIYAFGAIMHRILSGRNPQDEPPFSFPPLASVCPNLDPPLAALVDRALSNNPTDRPQSAVESLKELE